MKDGTVLLDISGLNSLRILDADHAVIAAGIELGPLYLGLYQNGNRAFPAGVCPGVGAGGHLTGNCPCALQLGQHSALSCIFVCKWVGK